MKIKIMVEKEVELKSLFVKAKVRYWEDSEVNGCELPESGEGLPCKNGDNWAPVIDIESGKIINWDLGNTADIYFKVGDQCAYSISDIDGNIVKNQDQYYVPEILCPAENGYGDYIIMNIDESGIIKNWNKKLILKCFEDED
ncbi:MAG: hypothetical protein KAT14_07805 [Candidatus Marinimicrobia bacterium]|nr:hypothetical protein [Candidatus Neomarinimicrobiota bacterium]